MVPTGVAVGVRPETTKFAFKQRAAAFAQRAASGAGLAGVSWFNLLDLALAL